MFDQDGWILASFIFWVFMDLVFVSVHKHTKKELSITHIYGQSIGEVQHLEWASKNVFLKKDNERFTATPGSKT